MTYCNKSKNANSYNVFMKAREKNDAKPYENVSIYIQSREGITEEMAEALRSCRYPVRVMVMMTPPDSKVAKIIRTIKKCRKEAKENGEKMEYAVITRREK